MVHGRSSAIQSQWTKIPGGTIHYRAVSAAADEFPVVFLIHGLIVSSRYMVPTAERLAPFCRVYAPDLPGYGKSYKPGKVLTLSELADALADWMDALEMANLTSSEIRSVSNQLAIGYGDTCGIGPG
jgi:2-hydroxy-6-oxonona-2,4-dienedioate hydrolase